MPLAPDLAQSIVSVEGGGVHISVGLFVPALLHTFQKTDAAEIYLGMVVTHWLTPPDIWFFFNLVAAPNLLRYVYACHPVRSRKPQPQVASATAIWVELGLQLN